MSIRDLLRANRHARLISERECEGLAVEVEVFKAHIVHADGWFHRRGRWFVCPVDGTKIVCVSERPPGVVEERR